MSDYTHDSADHDGDLEQTLTALGPLMGRQERLEREGPDAAFALALRQRLTATHPSLIETPVVDPVTWGDADAQPLPTPIPRRSLHSAPLVALAAIAAALLVLLRLLTMGHSASVTGGRMHLAGRGSQATPPTQPQRAMIAATATRSGTPLVVHLQRAAPLRSARSPRPAAATTRRPRRSPQAVVPALTIGDLTRDYPPPPRCCGGRSLAAIHGTYPGRLRLIGTLPPGPLTVTAYRLHGPTVTTVRLATLARLLGIAAPRWQAVTVDGQSHWIEAAIYAPRSTIATRSLALSTFSGELIYRDARSCGATRPQSDAQELAAVRAWLQHVGRSPTVPVISTRRSPGFSVSFGWTATIASNSPSAIISTEICAPGTVRVTAAHLWPPLDPRAIRLPAMPLSVVVQQAKQRPPPLAVILNRAPTGPIAHDLGGSGTIATADLVYLRIASADGTLYLVPAYRLSGPATVTLAIRRHTTARGPTPTDVETVVGRWYALVPASERAT